MGGDKKTLIILLIILGVVAVVGALYFFNVLRAPESDISLADDIKYREVYNLKETAINNILDFATEDHSILDNFYNDVQYQSLKDIDISIDLKNGIGNKKPFNPQNFIPAEDRESE